MNQRFRLTKSTDFNKIKKNGKTYLNPIVKMMVNENGLTNSRFAIITSKFIGNAVERNRCKRRLRAVLNQNRNKYASGWDFIFIVRKRFLTSNSSEIQAAVEDLALQAGLLKNKEISYDH